MRKIIQKEIAYYRNSLIKLAIILQLYYYVLFYSLLLHNYVIYTMLFI